MKEQEQNQKLNNKDHSLGDKIISGAKKVWKVAKWPLGIAVGLFINSKLLHDGNNDKNA